MPRTMLVLSLASASFSLPVTSVSVQVQAQNGGIQGDIAFNNLSLDGGDYNNGFFSERSGGQRAAVDITLEAEKEFQVVAPGANSEFGRTGGGVINLMPKSGSNKSHGSLFHYQRLEALTSATSDGTPLT